MTAQINDTCFHRKIEFDLAGISGSGLFDPASLGVQPVATSSACWRGYVAHYSIVDDELFLTGLDIGLPKELELRAKEGKGPELFGVLPSAKRFSGFIYQNFRSPVAFSGGLLLADGFIRELYVHMGFHPAWKYQCVRELIFNQGRVTEDHDRSREMADARSKIVEEIKLSRGRSAQPNLADIAGWVEKCFSRDYRNRRDP